MRRIRTAFAAPIILASLALAGCADGLWKSAESNKEPGRDNSYRFGSVLGDEGGLNLFGGNKKKSNAGDPNGLGVNSYLWRASLDTLAFMPIVSADPFGGVILTDWYTPPETPNERFKVNLYIMDRQLRADGVRVSVFKQQRNGADWRDTAVTSDTGPQLEDAILTRARQLRAAQIAAQ
ncbi:MAG TPA: DUF3576 domain-containing protein [Azospirillum sp.]|nr:DUF3576 domain-containing protein [Azospirillum sp.]